MILVDTNVISELMRVNPDPAVRAWMTNQFSTKLFISAISEAELRYGALLCKSDRKRTALLLAIEAMLAEQFAERILPFDSAAAVAYADIMTSRRAVGRPISQFDAQVAAIARSRGAELATRNVPDFDACGVRVLNPWDAKK